MAETIVTIRINGHAVRRTFSLHVVFLTPLLGQRFVDVVLDWYATQD